jgi:MFS family permease
MTGALGIGAVAGGLVTATQGRTGLRPLMLTAVAFGIAIFLASIAPVLAAEYVALAAVGLTSVAFLATGNSTLQLEADPSMRGRVMALWPVAFMGSTPIGGPLVGWVVAETNGRVGLAVGGRRASLHVALARYHGGDCGSVGPPP